MKFNARDPIRTMSILIPFVGIVYYVLSSTYCLAQPVASDELITHAAQYDGKAVVYQGEAIGDIMRRGEFAWINVSDGTNAIGCWAAKGSTGGIKSTGSYRATGDRVQITGTFNHVCLAHGGDLDIHAESVRITAQGQSSLEQPSQKKIHLALLLLGVLCPVSIWSQLKRRPSRK